MAVEPLDWVSWWDARQQMLKIWHPWSYLDNQADQAMADALRSGQVHCRAAGSYNADDFTEIRLEEVISTLSRLQVYSDSAWAEYEITTTSFHASNFGRELGFGSVLRPLTSKFTKTARIRHPELVFLEFRDYLIHFKLPGRETLNTPARTGRPGPEPGKQSVKPQQAAFLKWFRGKRPKGAKASSPIKKLAEQYHRETGLRISDSTIQRALGRKT